MKTPAGLLCLLALSLSSFTASAVDIKIVKTWYQAGTACFDCLADSNRRELVPELLLNDETLVKVDEEKKIQAAVAAN